MVFVATFLVLLSQLTPASKPPQLFSESTNLQKLIDLSYNYSSEDIACNQCSGLFMEVPESIKPAVIIPTRNAGDGPLATSIAIMTTDVPPTSTEPRKSLKLHSLFVKN